MTSLPWVGWFSPNGQGNFSTWYGETRHVIVTNVQGGHWHPAGGVPDGSEVLEVPKRPLLDQVRLANKLNGIVVIVFNTFPIQPRTA